MPLTAYIATFRPSRNIRGQCDNNRMIWRYNKRTRILTRNDQSSKSVPMYRHRNGCGIVEAARCHAVARSQKWKKTQALWLLPATLTCLRLARASSLQRSS